jgi:ribonuclease D
MHGVYDIQHLVEVLDLPGKGLDAVLEAQLGVVVEHKKKYQRQNWITRPIEEGAKQYALSDVAHLFDLHSILLKKIREQDKVEELVFKLSGTFKDYDKKFVPGIFKTPAYLKMTREKKSRYEKIVDLRESLAKNLDLPAAMVLSKEDLVLVTENPGQIRQVRFDRRLPGRMKDQLVQDILGLG